MKLFNRILLFTATLGCGSLAWSQFANVFEIQATAMNEVNAQVYELNIEKKPGAALDIIAKAIGNLEKQQGVIPNFNPASVFEISFEDTISAKLKPKISSSEVFNFQRLPESSRTQVLQALEQKYSPAFFDMALQMRRFQLHHAYALRSSIKNGAPTASSALAAEIKALNEIVKTLSFPFLLKNASSGITYSFDFADILSSSISKTAISTEYASINSRLVELYVEIATDSKDADLVALKNSKRPNALTAKLFSDMQFRKADSYRLVMATEGNKLYVQ